MSDTLASVLTRQPDWTALPAATPPPIRRLLRRCLEKDRTRRLADIADARLDIDDALSGPYDDAPVAASTSRTRERLTWASALLLVGLTAAAMVAWATRPVSVPAETTRTLMSVAPTGGPLAGRIHSSNGWEARDRPGRPSPSRPMARRWCSARSGAAVNSCTRARWTNWRDTDFGHGRWAAVPSSRPTVDGSASGPGANSGRFLSVADQR